MSKRLILVLALAFVVGIAFAAYAEVQNVKVSGDLTVYGLRRQLNVARGDSTDDKDQAMASITRVKIDADLTDNVIATVRLLNERYWGEEADTDSDSDIDLDLGYVTLKEFLYSPLTLTIGRQELHFGNDMIVGDPDTNNDVGTQSAFDGADDDADLSARKAFDAIRLTLNYDPLVVDVVAAKVEENDNTKADDVSLYGVNANYALDKKTTLEGYYWLKHTGRENSANTPKGLTTHVVGGRIAAQPIDNLTYQLESAFQFGKYDAGATGTYSDRKAWGLETGLAYAMPKVKYTPSLSAGYAYFSGAAANYTTLDGKNYEGWDPMFENQTFGHIFNALFNQTNIHLATVGANAKLTDDVTVKGDYYVFWWAKPYEENQASLTTRRGDSFTPTRQKLAAHEIDLKATYDYTEDVQFCLLTGVLLPGSAFSRETSRKTTSEVIGSMKVTF